MGDGELFRVREDIAELAGDGLSSEGLDVDSEGQFGKRRGDDFGRRFRNSCHRSGCQRSRRSAERNRCRCRCRGRVDSHNVASRSRSLSLSLVDTHLDVLATLSGGGVLILRRGLVLVGALLVVGRKHAADGIRKS